MTDWRRQYPRLFLYLPERRRIQLKMPPDGSASVEVPEIKCQHCKVPLKIATADKRIGGHDYYTGRAGCLNCGTLLGELRVYVSTIFGIEEDERVLAGPWRVY